MNKFQAAEVNLNEGINQLLKKNFISCITLVGASHEVFDSLLKKVGLENSIEFLVNYTGENKKKIVDNINFSKNWIKHADRDSESTFEPTDADCIFLIALGIPAFFKLGGIESVEMKSFRDIYENFAKQASHELTSGPSTNPS